MKEIWKPVVGAEGYYEVSNMGNVRSLDCVKKYRDGTSKIQKGRPIKKRVEKIRYEAVSIRSKCSRVHVLVANAFIPKPEGETEIDHINGNRSDNRLVNLRRVSASHNQINKLSLGVKKTKYNTFEARIVIKKKVICLGSFKTAIEAIKARMEAEEKYYPGVKRPDLMEYRMKYFGVEQPPTHSSETEKEK